MTLIKYLISLIDNNPKIGVYTTGSTAAAGYIPEVVNAEPLIDCVFRYTMWSATILVAAITIYVQISKEIDRKRKLKKEMEEDDD